MDDTLIWSEDIAQAFTDAANWLTLCGANVNPEKFVFAQDTVQFAGGLTTVKPARKFTKAIAEFPIPTSTTDVRSWFGLVNQVAYTFTRADTMAPFRDKFVWTNEHQEAFEASKQEIIEDRPPGEDGDHIEEEKKKRPYYNPQRLTIEVESPPKLKNPLGRGQLL